MKTIGAARALSPVPRGLACRIGSIPRVLSCHEEDDGHTKEGGFDGVVERL